MSLVAARTAGLRAWTPSRIGLALGDCTSRSFATFDEKERGAEKNWVLQQEREQLMARAAKAKAMAEEAGHSQEESGEAELKAILGKNSSPAIIQSLLEWKKQRSFDAN